MSGIDPGLAHLVGVGPEAGGDWVASYGRPKLCAGLVRPIWPLYGYGLHISGLYSHALYGYGLHSYGLNGYSQHSHGLS